MVLCDSQQIYVEADAKMDTYEAEDPNDSNKRVVRTQLNLLMRTSFSPSPLLCGLGGGRLR